MWNPQNQQRPSGQSGEPRPMRGAALLPLLLVGTLVLALYLQTLNQMGRQERRTYSQFRDAVRAGQVESVVIRDRTISGQLKAEEGKQPQRFSVVRPSGLIEGDLVDYLEQYAVQIDAEQRSELQSYLMFFLFLGAMFLLLTFLMRRANPAERAMAFGKSRARQYVERDTKITFDDVAGIEEPKAELEEIVDYLRAPEKFRRLGGRIPRGVLLVGAPGTGKTLLAKAVAGEAKVAFFSMSGSDFVELFVGVGASRVRDLFRQAEQHSPCIVFIDELDALGKARGASLIGGGHDEREQTLNQLLVEMDGFDTASNVIVMAATNRPEILDPALLRPGRFDRQIMIPPPDINGREAILRVHIRGVKIDPNLDLRRVAARTPGFVGADLMNVVNEAALLAARKGHDMVLFEDFDEAIDRVSIGLERKSHVISEAEKRITAYHEAGHAVVACFCEHASPVHKVSIIPRGLTGGVTLFASEDDRHIFTQPQLHDLLAVGLGGRVAEEVMLGEVSTGASNDIKRITDLARSMVTELGMSELGPLNFEGGSRKDPFGFPTMSEERRVSDETAQRIDTAVRGLIEEAQDRARAILTDHRGELERVAERLLEVEVVDREELYGILGLPLPSSDQPTQDSLPNVGDGAVPADRPITGD